MDRRADHLTEQGLAHRIGQRIIFARDLLNIPPIRLRKSENLLSDASWTLRTRRGALSNSHTCRLFVFLSQRPTRARSLLRSPIFESLSAVKAIFCEQDLSLADKAGAPIRERRRVIEQQSMGWIT